jgi:hypothetical protein
MNEKKLSAIEKVDYIKKYLDGEEGYDEKAAKKYAKEVGKDLDTIQMVHSGRLVCPTGETIP